MQIFLFFYDMLVSVKINQQTRRENMHPAKRNEAQEVLLPYSDSCCADFFMICWYQSKSTGKDVIMSVIYFRADGNEEIATGHIMRCETACDNMKFTLAQRGIGKCVQDSSQKPSGNVICVSTACGEQNMSDNGTYPLCRRCSGCQLFHRG